MSEHLDNRQSRRDGISPYQPIIDIVSECFDSEEKYHLISTMPGSGKTVTSLIVSQFPRYMNKTFSFFFQQHNYKDNAFREMTEKAREYGINVDPAMLPVIPEKLDVCTDDKMRTRKIPVSYRPAYCTITGCKKRCRFYSLTKRIEEEHLSFLSIHEYILMKSINDDAASRVVVIDEDIKKLYIAENTFTMRDISYAEDCLRHCGMMMDDEMIVTKQDIQDFILFIKNGDLVHFVEKARGLQHSYNTSNYFYKFLAKYKYFLVKTTPTLEHLISKLPVFSIYENIVDLVLEIINGTIDGSNIGKHVSFFTSSEDKVQICLKNHKLFDAIKKFKDVIFLCGTANADVLQKLLGEHIVVHDMMKDFSFKIYQLDSGLGGMRSLVYNGEPTSLFEDDYKVLKTVIDKFLEEGILVVSRRKNQVQETIDKYLNRDCIQHNTIHFASEREDQDTGMFMSLDIHPMSSTNIYKYKNVVVIFGGAFQGTREMEERADILGVDYDDIAREEVGDIIQAMSRILRANDEGLAGKKVFLLTSVNIGYPNVIKIQDDWNGNLDDADLDRQERSRMENEILDLVERSGETRLDVLRKPRRGDDPAKRNEIINDLIQHGYLIKISNSSGERNRQLVRLSERMRGYTWLA